jgi:uncharacterized protein (TIGR04255 family)
MYPDREVFPDTPLALVAAEIRFTDVARLRQQQTRDEVTIALEGRFPFAEPLRETDVNLTAAGPPQVQDRVGVVLKNATSTEMITIMSESLTYETTAYTSFDELLGAISMACDTLVAAKVQPALRRVGVRYVNEVRVPETITDARQWAKWIDPRLIGQLAVVPDDLTATTTQSVSTFDLGEGRWLNFRYAALVQGAIVVPRFLKRPPIESGPFFVLDFDGFHDMTAGETVPLSSEVVHDALSAVHAPCGSAFQQSITDDARMLFRGTKP